ncbi:recombinase family protein [Agrobacterium vaccinii]|uniref:recombinase family protein n=1 Tax=Agrobacterium vaccinii TaxID=2735528 RepID=UPI001E2B0628|nr:recombinase family protein [Agrobacterium vaccinii]
MSHVARTKAFSYIRFSTPEQQRGDSLRRQTEAAASYALRHDLDLDTTLTFRDLGVSAFNGANEEIGRLGEFLAAVHHGDIPKGSYLLVESLDRLSRQKPRKAVKMLERICEAGIVLVTLDDQRVYTEEVLDDEPMALLVALLVASRAHEESAKKGRRVAEAWANKRRHAASRPLTALCPGWLRLSDDRTRFIEIPERVAVVRRVFEMTLAGAGQHSIASTLNKNQIPVFGRGSMWHRSYIAKLLQHRSVIGEFTPTRTERINGRKTQTPTETVEGYFPAIVDRSDFERVSAMSSKRVAITRSPVANMLAGLATCPCCGTRMQRVNKGGKKGGNPFLVCSKAKVGAGCDYRTVAVCDVQDALISKAQLLLAALPSPVDDLQEEWRSLSLQADALDEDLERIVSAIAATGHSKALLARLHAAEDVRDEIQSKLSKIEGLVSDSLTNRVVNTVTDLVEAAEAEEPDIPLLNVILRQLFDKVTVDYPNGTLWLHWKHAPGETAGITYAWPKS